MEIEGKVIHIGETLTGTSKSGKDWQRLDFAIETAGEYPKKVAFSAWGKTVPFAQQLNKGDLVEVSFNPESREYNDRWYTELRAWRLNIKTQSGVTVAPENEPEDLNPKGGDMPF